MIARAMDLDRHVASGLRALSPGAAICVGFSGGLDSCVLLDVLARVAPGAGHALRALHVHHGLSPNADAWAAFCGDLCAARGIGLEVERVHVERAAPEGLEAAARAARYAVYARCGGPVVALAHHRDDQAETVLLQILRGTGLKGAAAMPELRALPGCAVQLFRPLLGVCRAALRAHAIGHGLAWIEDESNASPSLDRNFLRHGILPRLDERFPGWREAGARFARHAAAADALLRDLARMDGAPERPGRGLRVHPGLSQPRRANALRAFLAIEGLAMPSEARLAEMARQLYEAAGDARIRIAHDAATLVRHRGMVQRTAVHPDGPEGEGWRVEWRGESDIELPGLGRVRFAAATGEGLGCAAPDEGGGWHFAPRRGGERMRLDRARPSRTVKNLLREAAMPEWRRAGLPLLFRGERVAWVPGIGVAAEFACEPGSPGLVPAWSPPLPDAVPG